MKEIVRSVAFDKKENPSYEDFKKLSETLKDNELIFVSWTLKNNGWCQALLDNKGELELL